MEKCIWCNGVLAPGMTRTHPECDAADKKVMAEVARRRIQQTHWESYMFYGILMVAGFIVWYYYGRGH